MKILLVFATHMEAASLLQEFSAIPSNNSREWNFDYNQNSFTTLIVGIGMVSAAFNLGKHLATRNYDFALNAGIGGCFDRSVELGTVVNVVTEQISELGAEDGENFIALKEMKIPLSDQEAEFAGKMVNQTRIENNEIRKLTTMSGITVNKVHGNQDTIREIRERYDADIESMEGSSFFIACMDAQLDFVQIRSVSNHVERRNTSNWMVDEAIETLQTTLSSILKSF